MNPAPLLHPSATVSPLARMAPGVSVGPLVVIEDDVEIGEGTVIETGTILHSGSRVGRNCRLGPYAVVGGTPMDTSFAGERSFAVLEDDVVLREFATVHRATGEGAETRVGAGTLVMTYAHVTHNVRVGRGCTLTTAVQLGGHCEIGDHAFLGSTAILHQFCRIGPYAMFGAGSAGNMDYLPFTMARGNPAKHFSLNRVGLKRKGITGERYALLEQAVRAWRKRDRGRIEELARVSPDVELLAQFIATSKRGVARFTGG